MSDENRSQFKFERDGVRVDIDGDWGFVQRMYRAVMRDIDRAGLEDDEEPERDRTAGSNRVLWVVRCGDMMRRVYMAEDADLAASPLKEALDSEAIGTLYIDKSAFGELLPAVEADDETLWAELTEAGQRELASLDV